ncbi:HNH endonuclease [Methanobrevibacter sp.]
MRKCIICNNQKELHKFNIEHVFPDSAGGKYKIENVCKDCNNMLGNSVDYDFLKNPLIKLLLISHDIRNKKGRLPRLFKNKLLTNNPLIKGTPIYNDRTSKLENVKYETDCETIDDKLHLRYDSLTPIEEIFAEVDLDNEVKIEILKKLELNDYNDEQIPFKYEANVDLVPIIIECLKISYEFACNVLIESYVEDEIAKNIREVLNNPELFDEMTFKQIPILNFKLDEVTINDEKHVVSLFKSEKHIIAHIMLLNFIECTVIISNDVNLFKNDIVLSTVIDTWNEDEVIIRHFNKDQLPDDWDITNLKLF